MHQQDGTAERLRETVLAFLASGGSPTRVAEELFLHKNTVSERIKKAEQMLGREVNENPVELEAALKLASGLGQAVLEDPGGVLASSHADRDAGRL